MAQFHVRTCKRRYRSCILFGNELVASVSRRVVSPWCGRIFASAWQVEQLHSRLTALQSLYIRGLVPGKTRKIHSDILPMSKSANVGFHFWRQSPLKLALWRTEQRTMWAQMTGLCFPQIWYSLVHSTTSHTYKICLVFNNSAKALPDIVEICTWVHYGPQKLVITADNNNSVAMHR